MDVTAHERNDKPATAARIYDFMLGGVHNFPADQQAAGKLLEQFPLAALSSQANRAVLRRMVSYLAGAGVSQFLDIGSGIPTQSNVHEVAQQIAPKARVVYVDIDPVAVAESLEILEGNELAIAVRGDFRAPQEILEHPQVRGLLDFSQPIALLLMGVLHFVAEASDPISHLLGSLPSGSYVAVSHLAAEGLAVGGISQDSVKIVQDSYKRQTATPVTVRTREQVMQFFAGCTLVDPGLVWMTEWRPAPGDPADFADDPRRSGWWAGLGKIRS